MGCGGSKTVETKSIAPAEAPRGADPSADPAVGVAPTPTPAPAPAPAAGPKAGGEADVFLAVPLFAAAATAAVPPAAPAGSAAVAVAVAGGGGGGGGGGPGVFLSLPLFSAAAAVATVELSLALLKDKAVELSLALDARPGANRAAHRTALFEDGGTEVVLRRGQDWEMAFVLTAAAGRLTQGMVAGLQVEGALHVAGAGPGADALVHALPSVPGPAGLAGAGWGVSVQAAVLTAEAGGPGSCAGVVQLRIPATAPVGRFTLRLSASVPSSPAAPGAGGGGDGARAASPVQVVPATVLFNAWCKEDGVYLAGEAERAEYVLNEAGTL